MSLYIFIIELIIYFVKIFIFVDIVYRLFIKKDKYSNIYVGKIN